MRASNNGTVLVPSERLALLHFRGQRGTGTYLDYEGAVVPPSGDVEDVPFYGRYPHHSL